MVDWLVGWLVGWLVENPCGDSIERDGCGIQAPAKHATFGVLHVPNLQEFVEK
jgi:hypothetical protein